MCQPGALSHPDGHQQLGAQTRAGGPAYRGIRRPSSTHLGNPTLGHKIPVFETLSCFCPSLYMLVN